jgi:hypothetical protein
MHQQPLIERLNDINELDQVSIWPLGVGWWVIIGVLSIIIFILFVWLVKISIYRKTWKYKALLELNSIQDDLKQAHLSNNVDYKSYLNHFNNLIRKVAIHKFPRNECAHLTGDKWLHWLSKNDPKKHNWMQHKEMLINMPYIDKIENLDNAEFKDMLHALKKWIR